MRDPGKFIWACEFRNPKYEEFRKSYNSKEILMVDWRDVKKYGSKKKKIENIKKHVNTKRSDAVKGK